VTIVNPEGASFATAWPCATDWPLTSSLNFDVGVANNVIAPIDNNGEVCFYTNVESDVIVDIVGYFSGTGADAFVGSAPKRFLDTRDGTGRGRGRGNFKAWELQLGGYSESGLVEVVCCMFFKFFATTSDSKGIETQVLLSYWPLQLKLVTAERMVNIFGGRIL
jgi:hypothetical protein